MALIASYISDIWVVDLTHLKNARCFVILIPKVFRHLLYGVDPDTVKIKFLYCFTNPIEQILSDIRIGLI